MRSRMLADVIFGDSDHLIEKNHEGNVRYRKLVNDYRRLYQSTKENEDRYLVVAEVVRIWRSLEPPGRFLVSTEPGQGETPYHDIGDEDARRRTSQQLSGIQDIKHRDDITASTAASSTVSSCRREGTAAETTRESQPKRPSASKECFAGSFRGIVMGMFGKDSFMNQYLP